MQLVLRLCSKTRWIAMLRVLPPTFEPALRVVKRTISLFNSFGAKSQNKLRVFVASFILYLNFKVTCRQAQGKAPHSYSRWSHLIEPQERNASVLFIWMVSVNFSPTDTKVNWFQWRPLATHTFLSWREYLRCLRKQALCFDNSLAFRSLLLLRPNSTIKIKIIICSTDWLLTCLLVLKHIRPGPNVELF